MMVEISIRLAVLCLFVVGFCKLAEARNINDKSAQKENLVVYTRKVHREIPKDNSDIEYVDHIYEIFNTRQMPPPDMFDPQAIDQFILCDFNPGLKECTKSSERKPLTDETPTSATLKPSTKISEPTEKSVSKPVSVSSATTDPSNEFLEPIPHLPKDLGEKAYEEEIHDNDHYEDDDYKDDDTEKLEIKDYDDDGEMITH